MSVTKDKAERPVYLYSLDIARGVAALAVVLWHWQHFFFSGSFPGKLEREEQPFYNVLFIFYEKGWMAVDFFFALSGFIFFRLYSYSIRQKKIGAREFFVLRFSRLYPLHLVCLLLVAVLQWAMVTVRGYPFVYPLNDTFHFVLNVFFASAWGFQKGFSFNAPIWSVSIEVLLYALFFIVMRVLGPKLWLVLMLAILGFFMQDNFELIGRGVFAFYMGGGIFFAFRALTKREAGSFWRYGIAFFCLLAWVATFVEFKLGVFSDVFSGLLIGDVRQINWVALWIVGLLLPLSILCMAIFEFSRGGGSLPGQWLGEISYASYLLHFPLQLIFCMVATVFGFDNKIFYNYYIWISYFLLLVGFSAVSYRVIELPMQRVIRENFYARRSKTDACA